MRLLVPLVPVLLAAALAPAAAAKGPLQLCGASACATFAPEAAIGSVLADGPHQAPAAPEPYYRIVLGAMSNGPLAYWLPQAGVLRIATAGGDAAWVQPQAEMPALLTQSQVGLEPLRPPKLTYAAVNGRQVRSPRGWLVLYAIGTPVAAATGAHGWLRVWLASAGATPWTDGDDSLWISRKGSYLSRDGELVRIPAAVAKRIRACKPLA